MNEKFETISHIWPHFAKWLLKWFQSFFLALDNSKIRFIMKESLLIKTYKKVIPFETFWLIEILVIIFAGIFRTEYFMVLHLQLIIMEVYVILFDCKFSPVVLMKNVYKERNIASTKTNYGFVVELISYLLTR